MFGGGDATGGPGSAWSWPRRRLSSPAPLFASEAEGLEEAAKLRKDLERGQLLDDPDLTVRGERWLAGGGAQELEAKTRESHRQLLAGHVLPTLGHVKLRELHRRHVKALVAPKRAERLLRKARTNGQADDVAKAPSKGGYAKNTVRLIRAALSTVLSDAVDDGHPATNPAFGAGRKRAKKAEALTQAERLQKSARCRGRITMRSWRRPRPPRAVRHAG